MSPTRFGLLLIALCLPLPLAHAGEDVPSPSGLEVVATTFNIRYGTANDGANAWPHRREAVLEFIKESDSDFVGLQEALDFQTKEIRKAVGEEYELIVRTRNVEDGDGEATPLLYRKERWKLDPDHHGTFWLSETPASPGSISWKSSLPRIVTWGRFEERSGDRVIWVFNTHFDHRSAEARAGAARLIARRLGDLVPEGEPVIVMGDLNAVPGSTPLKTLEAGGGRTPIPLLDTWGAFNPGETANCTINGWATGLVGRRIDYILVPLDTVVEDASIIRRRIEGRPISDHWPVRARLLFPVESEE